MIATNHKDRKRRKAKNANATVEWLCLGCRYAIWSDIEPALCYGCGSFGRFKKVSPVRGAKPVTTKPKAKANVEGPTGSANLPTGKLIGVRITRKEFRSLPLSARRRILKEQAEQLKHNAFLDALDCEEDP